MLLISIFNNICRGCPPLEYIILLCTFLCALNWPAQRPVNGSGIQPPPVCAFSPNPAKKRKNTIMSRSSIWLEERELPGPLLAGTPPWTALLSAHISNTSGARSKLQQQLLKMSLQSLTLRSFSFTSPWDSWMSLWSSWMWLDWVCSSASCCCTVASCDSATCRSLLLKSASLCTWKT